MADDPGSTPPDRDPPPDSATPASDPVAESTPPAPDLTSDDVRYAPRAVHDVDWIESMLASGSVGVLGSVSDGDPVLTTLVYVYDPDERVIYTHTADAGRTRENVAGRAAVQFTVFEMGRIIPAPRPVDFDVEYASVVVDGGATLLDDRADKRAALELLMAKYAPHLTPGEDYDRMRDASLDRTAVYRIEIEAWSGKRNDLDDDASAVDDAETGEDSMPTGAYDYEDVRTE